MTRPQQQPDCVRSGVAGIGLGAPQPHPALPVAFASASRTQQASASFGAGPPQQVPEGSPGVASGCG